MKPILLIAVATLCFAASEPIVSLNSIRTVEAAINDKVRSNIRDPYDLLGPARGTYVDGYGTVFTVELNLVLVSPLNISPFKPSLTEEEIASLHNRKARKVDALRETMRALMMDASKALPGLPPEEHIVLEAFLFNYRWEQSRGLPRRLVLTATKQKLLDAANRHVSGRELASLFEEQEL